MDKRPPMYYPPIYPGSQPQYHPTMPTQTYHPPIYYMPMGSFPYQYPPYPSQYYYKNPSVSGSFVPRNMYNKPRRLSNQGGSKSNYIPKTATTKPSQAIENPDGKVPQRIKPEAREGCNEQTLSDSLKNARFFIIKSYEKEHIKEAIRSGLWTSTQKGNQKLNDAYQEAKKEHPIFLFFSVNNSGFFQGVAEMSSEVFFDKYYEGWNQPKKWMGIIDIKWLFLKDVVNKSLKHISNPLNEGKPIPNSRDTQEIPFDAGIQVLKIFEEAANESKFLSEVLKKD